MPRYTSYPTAPHFDSPVTSDLYGAWLAAVPADASFSVYLHVPYCRAICSYCGCHTKAVARDGPVAAYARLLRDELALMLDRLGHGRRLAHVHWGGGTPSLLPADEFRALVEALKDGFDWSPDAEHAIELDPRTVTPGLVDLLRDMGVNRVSLGVQAFDATVQRAIGRWQPYEQVRGAVGILRDAGLAAINFDLMYGLPHQTVASLRRTIELAAGLEPARVSLFGYAHVPWLKKHQGLIDPRHLPGPDERLAQATASAAALREFGYEQIGLDHFARPGDRLRAALREGRLRRTFQGYTDDAADVLVGLGVSSIGRLADAYVQNASDLGGWRRAIEAGRLPVARARKLAPEDQARGEIIERLMCYLTVDVSSVARRHGLSPARLRDAFENLEPLRRDGLVELDGARVTVPEPMRPLVRVAASAFDAYLGQPVARHSIAI